MCFSITESDRAKNIVKQYEDFLDMLNGFNKNIFDEWVENVPQQIDVNLRQCLLKRKPSSEELIMNFNPQVPCLILIFKIHNF